MYIEKRGFGFIAPDDPGPEIFVHVKAVKYGALVQEARVSFDIGQDREGRKRAVKVMVIDGSDAQPPATDDEVTV